MAVIASTVFRSAKTALKPTKTTLTSSDTISYVPGATIVFYNITGSNVSLTIDGDGATTITPAGVGQPISLTSGITLTVEANQFLALKVDNIAAYMKGTIAVTGGTGVVACYLN